MLREINSVARGGSSSHFKGSTNARKKKSKSVIFDLGHSQVVLEINSVARGGLVSIFDALLMQGKNSPNP